jgi:hypothetical protein
MTPNQAQNQFFTQPAAGIAFPYIPVRTYTPSFAEEQAQIAANQAAGTQTMGGIMALPAANMSAASPNYADIVTKAYSDIGRSGLGEETSNIDQSGFDYWTGQLSSGAINPDQFQNVFLGAAVQNKDPAYEAAQEAARNKLVTNAYSTLGRTGVGTEESQIDKEGLDYWTGQLKAGAITPDQFNQAFNTAAEETYIKGAYKDIFGREAEDVGLNYWKDILNTTNKEDIYKNIAGGATTGEDILGSSKYLTGDYTPEAIQRYTETEEDLLNEYETFMKRGIDPTKSGLSEDYFSTVSNLYGSNVDSTINDVFGAGAADAFTAEQKQNFVDKLVSGDKTREDVKQTFATSAANKRQEAERLSKLYENAYGLSKDDSEALYAKLMGADYSGSGTVDDNTYQTAKTSFDKALGSEKDANAGLSSLLSKAAKEEGAENRQYFKDNPDTFLLYDNLEQRSDDPYAKYGEINDAAIYDANAVDKYLKQVTGDDNLNSASSFAHRDTRRFGIDVGGIIDGGSGFIKRGADALGVTKEKQYTTDGEGNQVDTGKYTISGDINKAAEQAGIDTTKYQDKYKTVDQPTYDSEGNRTGTEKVQVVDKTAAEQIYDAINDKYKNLYLIGTVNPDNPNDKSKNNFIYTPYQKTEDGKLVAMAKPTEYTGAINPDVYKKKGVFGGGFLGDLAQSLASIPGLPEIIGAITANPAIYAAAKGVQTGAYSNSLKDIGKSAGLAYLAAEYMPKVTKGFSNYLDISNPILNQAITQGAISGGVSALSGGSGTEGLTRGFIGGGVGGALGMVNQEGLKIADNLGIDPKYQSLFANTLSQLAPTILTDGKIDPTKVLMSYVMKQALKEGKAQVRAA